MPCDLGIHIDKAGFFRDIISLARHLPETSLLTLSVAGVTLLALVATERLLPRAPAPLIAVGGAITASWLFSLQTQGCRSSG